MSLADISKMGLYIKMQEKEKWQSLSEAQWRQRLSESSFQILRKSGTERAFTGAYWDEKRTGSYFCAGCAVLLFKSSEKFDSGCGWPSFTSAAQEVLLEEIRDHSLGMERVEIRCHQCAGHLGHVFLDGPPPLNTRYCINSGSLHFVAD